MIDGTSIRPGDKVLGLASSGLHTNGYSLARKILFEELKLKPSSKVKGLGNTVGDELLKVHMSYGPMIQQALKNFNPAKAARNRRLVIKSLAHITGGGFIDNIPRTLPKTCDVIIRKGSWAMPPTFQLNAERGDVAEREL